MFRFVRFFEGFCRLYFFGGSGYAEGFRFCLTPLGFGLGDLDAGEVFAFHGGGIGFSNPDTL